MDGMFKPVMFLKSGRFNERDKSFGETFASIGVY